MESARDGNLTMVHVTISVKPQWMEQEMFSLSKVMVVQFVRSGKKELIIGVLVGDHRRVHGTTSKRWHLPGCDRNCL